MIMTQLGKRTATICLLTIASCGQPGGSTVDGAAVDAATIGDVADRPDAQQAARVVLCVGDSLTLGAPELIGGYRAPLASLMPDLVFVGRQDSHGLHEGYSGQRIAQIRALVFPALPALSPGIVLLMAGTNDITIGTPTDAILADLLQLAEDFNAFPGVDRVIVGTVPFRAGVLRDQTTAFNAALPGAFANASAGIEVAEISGDLVFPGDFGDSTHPNAAGYAKMANRWAAATP